MAYFNGTEMRSLVLAAGLLLLGAAARLGLGPGPDDFSWSPSDLTGGGSAASLAGTRQQVAAGAAAEELASTPLGAGERLDPNTASTAQLRRLPGVGPARAEAIVAERLSGGSFESPADMARVPGIGPRTVDALRPHLSFAARPSSGFTPASRGAGSPGGRVNVNQAQTKELEQITGIGPALAARIITTRQRLGPFERPEDLLRVPGIGPVVLGRIRQQVRF